MSKAAILLRSTTGVDAGKSKKEEHSKLVTIFYKIMTRWLEYFNNVAEK